MSILRAATKYSDACTKREHVVAERQRALAFIAPRWWPQNPGHVLVIPRTHAENLYSIESADLSAVTDLVLDAEKVAELLMDSSPGLPATDNFQHWDPWRLSSSKTANQAARQIADSVLGR